MANDTIEIAGGARVMPGTVVWDASHASVPAREVVGMFHRLSNYIECKNGDLAMARDLHATRADAIRSRIASRGESRVRVLRLVDKIDVDLANLNVVAEGGAMAIGPETPDPGIYPDVPSHVYHSWKLPSNSLLNHLARSPLHCRWAMDHPTAQTPDMLLGEAFHALLLQPDVYADRFTIAKSCCAITASGKNAGRPCGSDGKLVDAEGRWFCGVHGKGVAENPDGPLILSDRDADVLCAMRAQVIAHSWAGPTLALSGMTEVSIVFDDPTTGVRCKMRADRILTHPKRRCVVDIKTTKDASDTELARTIANRGYHRQAAMYLRGCQAAGIDVGGFVIVAVEKEGPCAVNVKHITDEAIADGSAELDRLLTDYAECEESGVWSGYGNGQLGVIGLPAWARPRQEQLSEA